MDMEDDSSTCASESDTESCHNIHLFEESCNNDSGVTWGCFASFAQEHGTMTSTESSTDAVGPLDVAKSRLILDQHIR